MRSPIRRRSLLFALILTIPQCSADEGPLTIPPRNEPKPQLVALVGIQATSEFGEFQNVVHSEMMAFFDEVGLASDWLDAGHLPIHARVFRHPAEGTVFVELETAKPLDLEAMSKKVNNQEPRPVAGMTDAWVNGRTAVRSLPAENGRFTCLLGELFGSEPAKSPWFHHRVETELNKIEQQLLAKVENHIAYALVRGAPFVKDEPQVANLMGLVGPKGLVVAMGIKVEDGKTIIDQHYGLRVGQGMIGGILPNDAGDARELKAPPFSPDMSLHVNLGPSVSRTLEPYLAMIPGGLDEKKLEALGTLLDAWTGELTVHYHSKGGTVILARIDKESEKDVDAAFKALELGPEMKMEGMSVGIGRAGDLVRVHLATGLAEAPKPQPGQEDPFGGIAAPVKLLTGQSMIKAFQDAQKPALDALKGNAAYMAGYRVSNKLGRALFRNRMAVTIGWDKTGTHVRMRL